MYLVYIIIASACNHLLSEKFLKPDGIGLMTSGWNRDNIKHSKKAMMWLVYREQEGSCTITQARNGPEYIEPEITT